MDLRKTFAAVALVLCLLPFAVAAPLLDPDEGLHAAIAQEMVLRHDYVTPTFLGQPFLDKPILFFWAEAASLRIFGTREAAVRLPPVLFGLLAMLAVALLGRTMFDEQTGLFAGIVFGTMLLPAALMEIAVHDVALTPLLCAAAYAVWRTATRSAMDGQFAADAAVAGVALGLSVLTKGLVGVAFVGLFVLCLIARDRRVFGRLFVMLSLAGVVAVLVALPWYLLMERAHPGYLHYYFIERHLQGYLTATQRHSGRAWWYYLPVVLGGALPWTGFIPSALARLGSGDSHPGSSAHSHPGASGFSRKLLLLWTWFAAGFIFLSIGESKLATYVLPAFPALAIAIAATVVTPLRLRGWHKLGIATHATALAVLPSLGLAVAWIKYGDYSPVAVIGAICAAGLVILLAIRRAAVPARGPRLSRLAATTVVGLFATVAIVSPHVTPWMTARELADTLNSGGALPSRVLVLDERIGSLVFYLSPTLRGEATPSRIDETTLPNAIEQARVNRSDWLLAARSRMEPRLKRTFGVDLEPDARAGTFLVYRASTLRKALGVTP